MAGEPSFLDLLGSDGEGAIMEAIGYSIRDINPLLEHDEKIRAVKEAISSQTLDAPLESNYREPSFHWDGEREETKKQFKLFMEDGVDMDALIRNCLRKGYKEVLHQPLRVIRFLPNEARLGPKRAHPSSNSLSIFRSVGGHVGPENGMLKVYPGSHSLRTKEEAQSICGPPQTIRLAPNQVLVTLGTLWVELSNTGGGALMWKGCSEKPVGLDILAEHVLPFMKANWNGT